MPTASAEDARHAGEETTAVVIGEAIAAVSADIAISVAACGPGHGLDAGADGIAVAGGAFVDAGVRAGGAGALANDARALDTDLPGVAIGVAAAVVFRDALAVGAGLLARRAAAHPGVADLAGIALHAGNTVAAAEVLPFPGSAGSLDIAATEAVLWRAGAATAAADPGVTGLARGTLVTGHPVAPTEVGAIPVAAGVPITAAIAVLWRAGLDRAVIATAGVVRNAHAVTEASVRPTGAGPIGTDLAASAVSIGATRVLRDAASTAEPLVAGTVAARPGLADVAATVGVRAAAVTATVPAPTLAKQANLLFLLSPAFAAFLRLRVQTAADAHAEQPGPQRPHQRAPGGEVASEAGKGASQSIETSRIHRKPPLRLF